MRGVYFHLLAFAAQVIDKAFIPGGPSPYRRGKPSGPTPTSVHRVTDNTFISLALLSLNAVPRNERTEKSNFIRF